MGVFPNCHQWTCGMLSGKDVKKRSKEAQPVWSQLGIASSWCSVWWPCGELCAWSLFRGERGKPLQLISINLNESIDESIKPTQQLGTCVLNDWNSCEMGLVTIALMSVWCRKCASLKVPLWNFKRFQAHGLSFATVHGSGHMVGPLGPWGRGDGELRPDCDGNLSLSAHWGASVQTSIGWEMLGTIRFQKKRNFVSKLLFPSFF